MFHRVIKNFLAVAVTLLALAGTNAQAFSVSQDEINAYLAEKAEITDTFGLPGLFTLDYKLQNLKTKIGADNSDRVEISGLLDGVLGIRQQSMAGKLNLTIDTVPYYDAEKGAVYLRDIRILKWSGEPQKYMEQLETVMPLVSQSIAALMSTIPIYTLDESKPRDMLIKKFAKSIRVEPERLSLDAGIL